MPKSKNYKYYLKIINQIQKIRSKNNVNWMGLLKLSFKHAPKEAINLVKKIDSDDKKISNLLKKLSK
jgi:hypothetical protein|tara:strand:+ start:150 stop:350 length:201 start_codon:yes stop_codon:yes gene_type:complete